MTWAASKTWSVGDLFTSGDANTYVRDRLDYLAGEAWINLALLNSWTWANTSYSKPGYRLVGDMVRIRGDVTGGASGSTIGVLPAAYRPLYQVFGLVIANNALGRLDVFTNGNIQWTNVGGSNAFVMLDSVRWFIN